MDNKKEQERAELHKAIWAAATAFVHGGKLTAWDFKEYFLGFLFYRFISENLTNYLNDEEHKAGNINFDYSMISDSDAEFGRKETLEEKGFYILPSELFCNVRKRASKDKDLNITLDEIFKNIENSACDTASEEDMKGLFSTVNVNSINLGDTVEERNKILCKLLDTIGNLKLGTVEENSIDMFGDAYEYLISMYASTSGKKGGEFFTPQEVGELLARIVIGEKKEINKVYDPCCGSGGLLLKFAKILGKDNVKNGFYGQEINITTYNLARINMFLHDINYNNFNIARGDTLMKPAHWDDEPFDAIVSNPPYSVPWEGKDNPLLINDPRFSPAGILAPKGYADLAFTMHMLSWLSPKGTAAIVEYPGILYRGSAESKIRKYLVDNNFIDTIIQMPVDLFFGTQIPTCILILKKNKNNNNILFIDASNEFVRYGNKNKLTQHNIDKILEIYNNRYVVEGFSYVAEYNEVKENEYNLSINSYVKEIGDEVDINIEELNIKIRDIVENQNKLRKELDMIVGTLEENYYE